MTEHNPYAFVAKLASKQAPLEDYRRFTYECAGCGADFNGADWGPPPKDCPNCVAAGQPDEGGASWWIYDPEAPRASIDDDRAPWESYE
jgi:hypothetical protein